MLKPLLGIVRKSPLLRLLVFFHGLAVVFLTALYYIQGHKLWNAALVRIVDSNAGPKIVGYPARGASLLLPWHLLPHDVAWLALDALVFGGLTICYTYWLTKGELKKWVDEVEGAAADKLREAEERSAAADQRMRKAQAWEQKLEARESGIAGRESEAARREADARAYVEGKDAEIDKMNVALARLKGEAGDLRKEVRQLRAGSGRRRN